MSKPKKLKNKAFFTQLPKKLAYFGLVALLTIGLILPAVLPRHGDALLLNERSLKLSSSAKGDVTLDANNIDVCAITTFANPQGGCGAKAKHTVTFDMATEDATTGGIIIMYCTSPIFTTACTTPEGMTASFLDTVTVTGLNGTSNFTLDTAISNADLNLIPAVDNNGQCNNDPNNAETGDRENCVVMKRGTAQTETDFPTAVIAYGGTTTDYIKNPVPSGNENYTFYARVLVFSDTGYTTLVDYGGLAASTAQQVDILARVQEILRFSVGTTPTAKGNDPLVSDDAECDPYNDTGALTLGASGTDVLDPSIAYDDYSFFRINTNTVNGAVVAYSGETLASGANEIDEIGDPPTIGSPVGSSLPGTEQFGLAIDDAHTDYEFVSLVEAANYATGEGTITAGGTALFAFDDASETAPITIATSPAGITCDTGAVRYIANISTSTPAGIYRTTITYIATGTY